MPQTNPKVYLHRTNGSSATDGQYSTTFVEMAFVDQISGDSPSAVKALALTAPGIPRKGESHPSNPRAILIEKTAEPAGGGDSQCWVKLTYQTSTGSIDGRWTITDGGALTQTTTQLFPDTWERIRVTWIDPATKLVVDDTATIAFARPTRALSAEGEWRGSPVPESWFDAIGTVNASEWHNKPVGYWLCTNVDTSTKNQGSSYAVKATFMSRVHIDWSEYGLCLSSMTGKYVPVLTTDALQKRKLPYRYGMDRSVGGGITKVCPFRTNRFESTFRDIPF